MMIEKLYRLFWRRMTTAIGNNLRTKALRKLGYQVGKDVYIGPNLTIAAGYMDKVDTLVVGNRVSFGPNVTLVLGSHPNNSRLNKLFNKSWGVGHTITIGHDSWLGANSTVLPGVTISPYTVVGANSVVTHDTTPYSVVAGCPARVVKYFDKTDLPLEDEWINSSLV